MDNLSNAILIAGSLLIMVLMLSVCMSSLTSVKQTAQAIIEQQDRETDTLYLDYAAGTKTRLVSAETIIPTINRYVDENYRIEFYKGKASESTKLTIYTTTDNEEVNYFDSSKDSQQLKDNKENFLNYILYGDTKNVTSSGGTFSSEKSFSIKKVGDTPLYDFIKGKRFEERMGTYYQNEEEGNTNIPKANWVEKKVIVYILKT